MRKARGEEKVNYLFLKPSMRRKERYFLLSFTSFHRFLQSVDIDTLQFVNA